MRPASTGPDPEDDGTPGDLVAIGVYILVVVLLVGWLSSLFG